MKREVRLLPAAERDLSRLVDFLSAKTPQAAVRAATRLSASIRSLDQFAERGRVGPAPDLRELVIPFGRDAYIVQYRVDPEVVLVARVFHSREDRFS